MIRLVSPDIVSDQSLPQQGSPEESLPQDQGLVGTSQGVLSLE